MSTNEMLVVGLILLGLLLACLGAVLFIFIKLYRQRTPNLSGDARFGELLKGSSRLIEVAELCKAVLDDVKQTTDQISTKNDDLIESTNAAKAVLDNIEQTNNQISDDTRASKTVLDNIRKTNNQISDDTRASKTVLDDIKQTSNQISDDTRASKTVLDNIRKTNNQISTKNDHLIKSTDAAKTALDNIEKTNEEIARSSAEPDSQKPRVIKGAPGSTKLVEPNDKDR